MLPFTMAELEEAVANGDVTGRRHSTLPYTIYNYSPDCQYRNQWNDITLNCRGLILDDEGNVVARPWKKFFNLGQVDLPIQLTDPVEIMDKADGSLGILYPIVVDNDIVFDIHYGIATRGSFASEQAIHATALWREKYSEFDPLPGYTMLFEIVYPENRIVLNYDGMDDLILLGAVENGTGYYFGPNQARYLWNERGPSRPAQWPGPVVEVFEHKNISEALGHMDRENAEGFVVRSHNFMVKMKQPDYLDLHRLVTNMTPKVIWEKLREGLSVSEICADLPDEFHSMAEGFANPMIEQYQIRLSEILSNYFVAKRGLELRIDGPSRKEYAKEFTKSKDAKYYFTLLDGRTINNLLWSELKPKEIKNEYA